MMLENRMRVSCGLLICLSWAGCEKTSWIVGNWYLVSASGKPTSCYRFNKNHSYDVFFEGDCSGTPDSILSGKWELTGNQLFIQQSSEPKARLTLITNKQEDSFFVSGAISGGLYKRKTTKAELVKELTRKGIIKLYKLPPEWGCIQLNTPLSVIRKWPKEPSPLMLRKQDQALAYYKLEPSPRTRVLKEVYALGEENIEWVALTIEDEAPHETDGSTFLGLLETALGKPDAHLRTNAAQEIFLWRSYCESLRGSMQSDIDLTLFQMPKEHQTILYVSEGVISGVWDKLKHSNALVETAKTLPPKPSEPEVATKP